jgi:hypothetical protein
LTTSYTRYWLGGGLSFERKGGRLYFVHISLIVFAGNSTDPEKRPLLRAEWDCRKGYRLDQHAQPHWHIYPTPLNLEPRQPAPMFQETAPIQEFPSTPSTSAVRDFTHTGEPAPAVRPVEVTWSAAEHFHFAMAARWHALDKDPTNEPLDPLQLRNWVRHWLQYTLKQLEYVDSHR